MKRNKFDLIFSVSAGFVATNVSTVPTLLPPSDIQKGCGREYQRYVVCVFLILEVVYRTSGVIFFHRLLHSYTGHIERVDRGERDIVPSTQD